MIRRCVPVPDRAKHSKQSLSAQINRPRDREGLSARLTRLQALTYNTYTDGYPGLRAIIGLRRN